MLCNILLRTITDAYLAPSPLQLPEIAPRFARLNITSGQSLCNSIPQAELDYENRNSQTNATEPVFTVRIADNNCFRGMDSGQVGSSPCTPWEGDYGKQANSTAASPTAVGKSSLSSGSDSMVALSSANKSKTEGDSSNLFWIFIILAVGVVLLFVLLVVVVLIVLWRRRQAAEATMGTTAYPDLDELEDFE